MCPPDSRDAAPDSVADGEPVPPIDLQSRRVARELAGELDGLFGIDLPDIEKAIGRLYQDFQCGSYDERERRKRMPESLRQVMATLDRLQELAALIHQQERAERDDAVAAASEEVPSDPLSPTLQHVIELVENQLQRLRRMRSE